MTGDLVAESSSELITGIGELVTMDDGAPRIHDAAMVVHEGRIGWMGPSSDAPAADRRTSLSGRALLPGWVDSHSHLIFGGDRASEFEARMAGESYQAGGINSTVAATRAASSTALLDNALRLRDDGRAQGTTFLETKTGYGLDVETERRSAQIAAQVADVVSFLGAHIVPPELDRREYLDLVTGPMLEAVRPWCDFIDAFCEVGAFDVEESREVLLAGRAAGLGLRLHGNQLGFSGGVRLAVELGCRSVDHCNHLDDGDIDALADSATVATLLPACDLSTRQPFPPMRKLLDAGVTVALASNCNPGSSYTTSMPFCIAIAVLQMGMTIDEAIRAATRGGAAALGRDRGPDAVGVLRVGGPADFQVLDAPSVSHLAYRPGEVLTAAVWKSGVRHPRRVPPF